ncbi:carboxyltransferase domain-containing protein [Bifidobacterium saguinibicoloris]|uniref:5-oxoprolinase subunit B/C family protein n=1 Tax=Bifidobacterium saguinibicoloris TaxID=2834433 RepID=UPI001F304CBD|nr:carboxyltransferase domain-containing protein [Bifidobacterium saguinibicoloris]
MRFLPCGESAMIVECAGLAEALRLYTALDAACARARERGRLPEDAGGPGSAVDVSLGSEDTRTSAASHDGACGTEESGAAAADAAVLRCVTQLLPAARTVYVEYDRLYESRHRLYTSDSRSYDFRTRLCETIRRLDTRGVRTARSRTVEIPVVYEGEDLDDVASLLGVSAEQVVARHAGHPWTVAFGGFAPGFDYLTGGDPLFDVPRRKSPRLAVPAGSVGLAGTFSGVYPRSSSGGWQLIGVTSTPLWDTAADPPALLAPGDTVRFTPVRATASAHADEGDVRSADGVTREPVTGTVGQLSSAAHVAASPASDAVSSAPAPTSPAPAEPGTPFLEVVNPGVLSVFEDDGRHAPQMGVTGSGAADPRAFRLANELVGNPAGTPALELTAGGVSFTAHGDVVVAVAGAPASVTITASDAPDAPAVPDAGTSPDADASHASTARIRTAVPARTFAVTRQEAVLLREGETLAVGAPAAGLRDYLAVRGGFDVATILGSASTDTMSGIGPAPLKRSDLLPVRPAARPGAGVGLPRPWPDDLPKPGEVTELAVTLGPRDDWFTEAGVAAFLGVTWTVTAQSNRVGLRLAATDAPAASRTFPAASHAASGATHAPRGPESEPRSTSPLIARRDPHAELKSEATVPGSIEVPGNGLPLIFLRDQPVTGGYPVIAVLTREALVTAGQLPPGARVHFTVARHDADGVAADAAGDSAATATDSAATAAVSANATANATPAVSRASATTHERTS